MWQKTITNLGNDCKLHPPLSEEWIDKGLADLNVTLNSDLKSFLLKTDGLYDHRQFLWMVWNVRDLLAYNMAMRTHQSFANKGYSFDDIFFISNYGTGGILFGFPIHKGVMQAEIVAWYPETNNRVAKADNLKSYLKLWINQELDI